MKKHPVSKKGDIFEYNSQVIIISLLAIIMGVVFILSQNDNRPVAREEAISYMGEFEKYTSSKNYSEIYFIDGSSYSIYPHTQTKEFIADMKSLEKGTKLYVLVNPNNNCVAEIRTDTEEILNFEISQQEIEDYGKGYVWIGIFALAVGVFLIFLVTAEHFYKKKEDKKHLSDRSRAREYIREAEAPIGGRVLLETEYKGYHICYRRKRCVNELIVNGKVYDEKKGILEFSHVLVACVDGHTVEAGFSGEGYSYIRFDGKRIAKKKRLI